MHDNTFTASNGPKTSWRRFILQLKKNRRYFTQSFSLNWMGKICFSLFFAAKTIIL